MKIGIVLSTSPGYSETFFNSKIKGLKESGIAVLLFCKKKEDSFRLCPVVEAPKVSANPIVMTYYFLKEFVKLLPCLKRVIKFIALEKQEGASLTQIVKMMYLNAHLLRSKLDWLHFGFTTLAIGSETVAKTIGAKMAVSFRGFDIAIYPLKNPGCYNTLWNKVDKVHTISKDLLETAHELGLPKNVPVQKITPAIDGNFFSSERDIVLNAIGTTKFLTVGRLHWKKGYVFILEALALLKEKGLNFTYTIVGSGTKKEYERIAFTALQLGIKEDVVFAGTLNRQQVKEEYKKVDIYLQYSISEGFCNAVLEAQSMKKLCIVSNAEGLDENVLHKKTGWVVPKLEPELLAAEIDQVIKLSENEKKQLTEYAANRVKRKFNIEKQQKEFINFYETKSPPKERA